MENNNQDSQTPSKNNTFLWLVLSLIVVAAIVVFTTFHYLDSKSPNIQPIKSELPVKTEPIKVVEPPVAEPIIPDIAPDIVVEPVANEVEENIPVTPTLPDINESDSWLKEQLANLTWRKELLRLVIDDDMVRRFVVFTDNFAQGSLAYEYTPLTKPTAKFTATVKQGEVDKWNWDDAQAKRFSLYVDFLRSFEPERLAQWYVELKPLINQAYEELGYPDRDFSDTLQDAIVRVLDMELPKEDITLVRPSVMYKFEDPSLEQLPEAEKLLLRMGKDNLLIIKSFLLEFSDALSRAENK